MADRNQSNGLILMSDMQTLTSPADLARSNPATGFLATASFGVGTITYTSDAGIIIGPDTV
jgi:hypothetical protein